MSFLGIEKSIQLGSPVELYEFRYTGSAFYYTSAKSAITKGNTEYEPLPLKRSDIRATTELEKRDLTISGPRDWDVADLFRVAPPSDIVTVTVYRKHVTDSADEFVTMWQGRVLNASWQGQTVELSCESAFSSTNRNLMRRKFGVACPYDLYGPGCRASKIAVRQLGTVSAVNGTVISTTVAGFDDHWFAGGYVSWTAAFSALKGYRAIHDSDTLGNLTLSARPDNMPTGTQIEAYPGCNHTVHDCAAKFNNLENYGGFPYFPHKNPFGGNPIF